MARERFHTVVLVGYDWPARREPVIELMEEILAFAGSGVRLSWSGGRGDGGARELRGTRLGRQERDLLASGELESVSLGSENPRKLTMRMSFQFEAIRYRLLPEYVLWLHPDLPEQVVEEDTPKLLTFSLADRLYRKKLSRKARRSLSEAVKTAFTELDAACGFATETDLPVTSAYTRRPGAGEDSEERFVDLDYRRWLDGVHEENLLSPHHAERVRAGLERLAGLKDIEVEWLQRSDGTEAGARLGLEGASRASWKAAREELASLLPSPRPSVFDGGVHLVLRRSQVTAIGGLERLASSPMLEDVRELPGGLVDAVEVVPEMIEETLRSTAEQRRLFEPIYRAADRRDRYPHEDMVQHTGFADASEIYQRLPRVEAEERGCAFLYVEERNEPESTEIHFLVEDASGRARDRVRELFDDWLGVVRENPGTYGTVELQPLREANHNGRVHLWCEADLSGLQQDAINLLLVRIDELNEGRCIVPFVVLGRIDPERYRKNAVPVAEPQGA